ncbi:MAG: 3-phosphoshikimate 1-carboxyvinyltransferase [Candidatus Omnitrophota bacterium]|nr:3-phosphoshikimate 1-carboxyvinyltransferase [Candidatus Omnitrophota bacterium]
MKIEPVQKLSGSIEMPGDKSISHRAVMLGSIAVGTTEIKGLLDCDDCNYTIRAFKDMGIAISKEGGRTTIEGKGLKGLKKPRGPIDVGESGTTMRLLAGILAGQDFDTVLKGDPSLSKRPMGRVVEPLSMMGVNIKTGPGGYAPLTIRGGVVMPVDYLLPVPSAQIKSAILLAALYADGVTTVSEKFASRDHTERMLKYFGAVVKTEGTNVSLEGGHALSGKFLEIPGDISSASFFIAGAMLLKGSRVKILNVNVNPARAGILDILEKMDAKVVISDKKGSFEPVGDIEAEYSRTRGIIIEEETIPGIIDELPVIFVLASLSSGRTVVKGAGELRVKETDRIKSMTENLRAMGARITVEGTDVVIDGVEELKGAGLRSFGDHRTCMAMAIAALAAKGSSVIDDTACVSKSFPDFFGMLEKIKK